jgi:hypothetical protein
MRVPMSSGKLRATRETASGTAGAVVVTFTVRLRETPSDLVVKGFTQEPRKSSGILPWAGVAGATDQPFRSDRAFSIPLNTIK